MLVAFYRVFVCFFKGDFCLTKRPFADYIFIFYHILALLVGSNPR